MDNLITSFQEHIRDRLSSPLAAAFAVSWGLINYRFLLVLFSGKSVEEKLLFIDQIHFSSLQQTLLSGIVFPLVAAVSYILIYPPVSRLVMIYLLGQQRLAREIRQVIEQETPMSKEEATELRRQFNSRIAELENEVTKKQQTIAALRQSEDSLEAQLEERTKEIVSLNTSQSERDLNMKVLQNKSKEMFDQLNRTEAQLQAAMTQIAHHNEVLADKEEKHNEEKRELVRDSLKLSEELTELRSELQKKNAQLINANPMAAGLVPVMPKMARLDPLGSMLNKSLLDSDN